MQSEIRTLTSTDLRVVSSTPLDTLGASGFTADNRQFTYIGVGASAVAAGQLLCTPAVVSNHQGISIASGSSTAAGSNRLLLTLGATAATKDQYADGYLTVVTGTGAGYAYRIRGNSVGLSSGTVILDLYNDEPLIAAVDGTSTFNVAANISALLVATTTASHAVGVASTPISANNYGWVQTYGYCSALIQGSIGKGNSISQSTTTGGAVAIASGTTAILGNTLESCTNNQYNSVFLQIT